MTAFTGRLPAAYTAFADDAGYRFDGLAAADYELASGVRDGAAATHAGRAASANNLAGAAADTARIGPLTGTPAGQRALIVALQQRISRQREVVAAYQARDARMAALIRRLAYQGAAGLGGGDGGSPFSAGGGLGSGASMPRFPAWAGERSLGVPRVERVAAHQAPIPAGPAAAAVDAALDKRGRPYVWGAKGPNVFDCSGLTQWAWRQAGVQLGGDTYSQIANGVPVAPGDVRAGDLVFPTSSFGEDGRPGPGHVMLAISPTQVVHAPHTGDVVRVAPMPAAFVARRPVPLTAT